MRLDDFQQEEVSRVIRYALPVGDEPGNEAYELLIVGPEQQVRDHLADSDIEVTVREDVTDEEWREQAQRELSGHQQVTRSVFDDPRSWAKPPSTPSDAGSIRMGLRATRPSGTAFTLQITNLILPVGSGPFITLFLQPVLWVTAQVQPTRGDPDLTLSGVTGGIAVGVFNSALPDGLPDTVFGQIALPSSSDLAPPSQ
jgi:hypothetical protein